MKFIIIQFPIILVSIAYALGIFIINYSSGIRGNTSFFIGLGIAILVVLLEKFMERRDELKTILTLSTIVAFSFFINYIRIYEEPLKNGLIINSEITITKLFNSSYKYQNCIVKDISSSEKYLAQIKLKDSIGYKVGSKLFVEGYIENLSSLDIPQNFNFSKYLKRRSVGSKLIINSYIETGSEYKTSTSIEEKIDNSKLTDTSKGLMKALVLGRKDGIPDELLESFSDSGIMHLLALSGLHIGILTIVLTFILKPIKIFRRGKLIRSIIVVILLWYYAYVTGFSSSIIRATIMFSIIVIGHGMRREINIYNSLAIAALVLLVINPNYLFDVGFQLSFSAVIGIVWIFPLLNRFWTPKNKVIGYFWSLLLVSISAQVATFPFTVYYFHKFSGLFFIANMIEIPLITFLLGMSYLILVLLLFGFEISLLNYIYDKTVLFIEWISINISTVESMVFENLFINQITVALLLSLIIAIIIFIQTSRIKHIYIGLFLIISIQVSSVFSINETSSKQRLMMAKDELIIQNGYDYRTSSIDGAKLFSNYTKANDLKLNNSILGDVFSHDDNYYWRKGKSIDYNPLKNNHVIIVNKYVKSNPQDIVNIFTKGVVYSGYSKSIYKSRWDYYCSVNNISFYDVNDVLLDK